MQHYLFLLIASVVVATAPRSPNPPPLQETSEVRVGDFLLLRSVDFMTDEVSYVWARSGDSIPSGFTPRNDPIPGYETLELSCAEDRLKVLLRFRPPIPGGIGRIRDPNREVAEVPRFQRAPVQFRFDSEPPLDLVEWVVDVTWYQAEMPQALVDAFIEGARPATRLRARVGPFTRKIYDIPVESREELEFSLVGSTRAIQLLDCGGSH